MGTPRESTPLGEQELGRLLGLVVHDLRNPVATISANVSFLREEDLAFPDEDAREAFDDLCLAVGELHRGLEQIGWVTRWLLGEPALGVSGGDVVASCREAADQVEGLQVDLDEGKEEDGGRPSRGLVALLALLLRNSRQHAPDRRAALRVLPAEAGGVRVELHDAGPRLPEELAERAFTVAGQYAIKRSAGNGRYGRYLGLLAARAVADAIGASLRAGTDPSGPAFVVELPASR